MKNYHAYFLGIALVFGLNACVSTQPNANSISQEKSYVSDDLYDTERVTFKQTKKVKPQEFYSADDSEEIVIEEQEGLSSQSKQQNFLNSRSVYSNYDQGYSDGFRNGVFNSTPWNNWYSNPYVNFGYNFYRPGLNFITNINPYSYISYSFSYGALSYWNPNFSLFNPYVDPYFGYYSPYGTGFNSPYYYNPYNYYSYLNSTSGYGTSNNIEQPRTRVVRGPRDEDRSNRYNEGYVNTGGARNSNNQYNLNFNNQSAQQVQTVQEQRNIVQEYQRVQQRRNSNVEYNRSNNNDYQNNNRDVFMQQNRTTNYGNSSSGSSYSGGGSYQGGGSRGPR